jgi:hypothetical protein
MKKEEEKKRQHAYYYYRVAVNPSRRRESVDVLIDYHVEIIYIQSRNE